MSLIHTIRNITVSALLAMTSGSLAFAEDTPPQNNYNCAGIYSVKAKDTYFKLKAADVESCIMRGWDPPGKLDTSFPADYNWQPAGGTPVRTGNAGNLEIGAKQPPATPPGASSSSSPVGTTGSVVFFGNQPNQSTQCLDINGQRVCPRCSLTTGQSPPDSRPNLPAGQNECLMPVLDPATGQITYYPSTGNEEERALEPVNPVIGDLGGQLGPISRAQNGIPLSCGGTMNLSNIETSSVVNATHLVIANPLGAYEVGDVPQYTCSTPPQTDSNGNVIPPSAGGNYDCQETPTPPESGDDTSDVRIVYVYAKSGNSFRFMHQIRLAKKLSGVDKDNRTRPIQQFVFFNLAQGDVALRAIQPREEAQDQGGNDGVVYNTADEEKYVIVSAASLINNSSRPSKEKFERYPRYIPDFRIIPQQTSDDITMELPLNTEACKDRVLYMDLSTPNLVQQPGTVTNVSGIIGTANVRGSSRSEKATVTTDTSIMYFQPETFLRIAAPGKFIFRGPIAMELPDLRTIHMYGPTTFTNTRLASGAISAHVNLGGGGHIENVEGQIVDRIPITPTYPVPGLTAPYYVIADEKVYLPTGLTLTNEREGYLRQPSCPPPNPENPCAAPPAGCTRPPSCAVAP